MNEIRNYLNKGFGLDVSMRRLEQSQLAKLPLYIRGAFEFWSANLLNNKVLFVAIKEGAELSPVKLKKQAAEIAKFIPYPIVYIFPELESWNRSRLIEQHVAFIEPDKQLYVPELLLHLNDVSRRSNLSLRLGEKLSMSSQAILLHQLNTRKYEPFEYQQMANAMGCSLMTISRSIRELSAAGLAVIEEGRPNLVHFITKGKKLWEQALPLLSSPIKSIWRSEKPLKGTTGIKMAGITALSHYSMLSKGSGLCYAIGKHFLPSLKKRNPGLHDEQQQYGEYQLQVWDYVPDFTGNPVGGVVDRLSLYLSMRDQVEDERTEAALQELINEMEW